MARVFFMFLAALICAYPAAAGPLTDAYDRESVAVNKAYGEYKKLGSNPTREQLNEVDRRILTPARVERSNAIASFSQDLEKKIRSGIASALVRVFAKEGFKPPTWLTAGGASGAKSDGSGGGGNDDSPKAKDVSIDGSSFQKELEFSGSSSKKAPTEKKPSPAKK